VAKRKFVPFYLFWHPRNFTNLWSLGRAVSSIYKVHLGEKNLNFRSNLGRPTRQHAARSHYAPPGPNVSIPITSCARHPMPPATTARHDVGHACSSTTTTISLVSTSSTAPPLGPIAPWQLLTGAILCGRVWEPETTTIGWN
jgi:hypothetical protein